MFTWRVADSKIAQEQLCEGVHCSTHREMVVLLKSIIKEKTDFTGFLEFKIWR